MYPGKAPQNFSDVVYTSVDRADRPTLAQRMFPLLLIFAQCVNVLLCGAILLGLGYFGLMIFDNHHVHVSGIYLTGTTLAILLSIPYVALHMLFVLFRNFIFPQ
jgi:hypothetical protein